METGENPVRSRHCNEGVLLMVPLRLLRLMPPDRKVWEGEQNVDI